jgi:hypothetical protein
MEERQRSWGPTWLFVLWAVLVVASIAGKNVICLPGAFHSGKNHVENMGSFTMGVNRGAMSTTQHVSR